MHPVILVVWLVVVAVLAVTSLLILLRRPTHDALNDYLDGRLAAWQKLRHEELREHSLWIAARFDAFNQRIARAENQVTQMLRDFHEWHPTPEDLGARELLEEWRAAPQEQRDAVLANLKDAARPAPDAAQLSLDGGSRGGA